MSYAAKAYAKIANETAPPRELEACLLLNAAAKLQAVHDLKRPAKFPAQFPERQAERIQRRPYLQSPALDDLHRRRDASRQQAAGPVCRNLKRLGMFVMAETFAAMTEAQAGASEGDDQSQSRHRRRLARQGLKARPPAQAQSRDQAARGISNRSRPRRCGMRFTSILAASARIKNNSSLLPILKAANSR